MKLPRSRKGLVILRRANLEYHQKGSEKVYLQDIVEVKDLEVKDAVSLQNTVRKFALRNKIKKSPVIIILSDEILFKKIISRQANREQEMQNFLGEIPFEPEKIAKITIDTASETVIVASNKNLYEEVDRAFEKAGFRVLYVLPQTIFGQGKITWEEIAQFLKDKSAIKTYDFLFSNKMLDYDSYMHTKKKGRRMKALFTIFGLLVVGGTVGYMYLNQIWLFQKKTAPVIDEPTSQVQQQPSQEIQEPQIETEDETEKLQAQDVNVLILNATTVAGLASSAKNDLTDIEFGSVEVGNADTNDNTITNIKYLSNVSEELANQLLEIFQSNFEEVVLEEVDEIEGYNEIQILITLGTPLDTEAQ